MEENKVVNYKDKPHSLEIGKASMRHKIAYNHVHELKAHIEALKQANLWDAELSDIAED